MKDTVVRKLHRQYDGESCGIDCPQMCVGYSGAYCELYRDADGAMMSLREKHDRITKMINPFAYRLECCMDELGEIPEPPEKPLEKDKKT